MRPKVSAGDDVRLDAAPSDARGGARSADVYPSSDARLETAVGYSRRPILSTSADAPDARLRHAAGLSHADEARVHTRMRQLQHLLNTMNRVQQRSRQTPPVYV